MRVLMITDFYEPYVGGVEQHVRTLCHALTDRGHEVTVATLWRRGLPPLEFDDRVRVHRIRGSIQRASWLYSNATRCWAPPFPDPETVSALRGIIQREQPEVVHGHDWLLRSFLPLKTWSGAALVVSLHYYIRSCAKKSLIYKQAPCAGPGLMKCLTCSGAYYGAAKGPFVTIGNFVAAAAEAAKVDQYIAVSAAAARGNGLIGSNLQFQVIPNFLPDQTLEAPLDCRPYEQRLPAEDYLLFVGDMRYFKGVQVLLSAYADLSNPPPLVFIGKDSNDRSVALPSGARAVGEWPHAAVMHAWQRSLGLVVPSVGMEPFGMVALEAMAAGRPVIASAVGGLADLVRHGETGLLVRPNDPSALRDALATLVADPALRERLGRAGHERSRTFGASVIVPRIEAVYKSAILRARRRDKGSVDTSGELPSMDGPLRAQSAGPEASVIE